MTDATIDEKALQADIDEARTKLSDTKQLYKWVCSILFFKYGITPTTNRLYQLVRKGSMQTVTTSLAAFWQELRDRSRLKIDHPGVPEALIGATGDLIQTIWERASIEAKAFYEAAAYEASAKVDAADVEKFAAEKRLQESKVAFGVLEARLAGVSDELKTALGTLEADRNALVATTARLEEARAEVLSLRSSLTESRHDFANELEKARAATRVAEEREAAAERRMLLEIDRERTTRAEAERASSSLREALIEANKQASTRGEVSADEIGQLKGKLAAVEQMAVKRDEQIASMRQESSALISEIARCSGEAAAARDRISALEFELAGARAPKSKSAKVRKS
jgi:hypothetical protein